MRENVVINQNLISNTNGKNMLTIDHDEIHNQKKYEFLTDYER